MELDQEQLADCSLQEEIEHHIDMGPDNNNLQGQ